jgi:hypothetical protein
MFTIAKLLKILKPYSDQKKLAFFDQNLFNSFYSAVAPEEPSRPVFLVSARGEGKD